MADAIEIFLRAIVAILAIIAIVRVTGLRSFSKMSSFDFALTVAMGSVLAGTIVNLERPLWQGIAALAAIFAVQAAIAKVRAHWAVIENVVDNTPTLLMDRGELLEANLTRTRVTRADVLSKLREANALDLAQVHAVVLETTGDISVLHGEECDAETLATLLKDVRNGRAE